MEKKKKHKNRKEKKKRNETKKVDKYFICPQWKNSDIKEIDRNNNIRDKKTPENDLSIEILKPKI